MEGDGRGGGGGGGGGNRGGVEEMDEEEVKEEVGEKRCVHMKATYEWDKDEVEKK